MKKEYIGNTISAEQAIVTNSEPKESRTVMAGTTGSYLDMARSNPEAVMGYLKKHDLPVRDLDLSASAYNMLKLCGFQYLSEFVLLSDFQIQSLPYMTPGIAKELTLFCSEYLVDHKRDLSPLLHETTSDRVEHIAAATLVKDLHFSTRAKNSLNKAKIKTVDDLLSFSVVELLPMYGVGISTVMEIREMVETLLTFQSGESESHEEKAHAIADRPPPDNSIRIEELGMNVSLCDDLKLLGFNTIQDFKLPSQESLLKLRALGPNKLYELARTLRYFRRSAMHQPNEQEEKASKQVNMPESKNGTNQNTQEITSEEVSLPPLEDFPIEALQLSTRSYNCLKRANINTIQALMAYSESDLLTMRNMGKNSVKEISLAINQWRIKRSGEAQKDTSKTLDPPDSEDKDSQDRTGTIKTEEALLALAATIPVESLGLSVRAYNCLYHAGIRTAKDLLEKSSAELAQLKNVGKKTVEELERKKEAIVERAPAENEANRNGLSDERVKEIILEAFADPFSGLSWREFRELIPDAVDDARVKQAVGCLISEKKLEYVDYRCYKVYPTFCQYLQDKGENLKPRLREVLTRRYSGQTLEGIAQDLGLTRERVRQLQNKAMRKLRFIQSNVVFDEDYYEPLYTTYDVPASFWRDEVKIAEESLNYLKQTFASGKKPLEEALEDETISVSLRYRIRAYLDRGKVKIDGELFPPKLIALMDCALKKCAEDEIPYDQFSESYNEMLERNGIPGNSDFYITEDNKQGRGSRLSTSMYCLWKQGECLRYYDISSRDYTELLEGLHLESYQNTELSTRRFVELYPGLMRRYDIRDANELHNLLKKISGRHDLGGVHFSRQPVLTFGVFDRRAAIREIIEAFQPITTQELLDYLSSEYGYDRGTATGYLTPFKQYYHKGVYTMDFKKIPEENAAVLKGKLQEDFYYIDEIKALYLQLFPDGDPEEINPYSLKALGFLVLSKYVIQHHDSALAYFTDLLTKQYVYDIGPMLSRYGTIQMFNQCYYELLKQNEIFLFDKGQIITMRRLNRVGVNKDMIHDYCDAVREELQDGQYFTIPSLRNDGFEHPLDDIGFDDYFYASLLGNADGFVSQRIFGSVVLCCGSDAARISAKSFLYAQLLEYESVDVDDFISDIKESFGVDIPNRYEVRDAVAGTELYYDPIMEKIYRDKSIYYSEFDD